MATLKGGVQNRPSVLEIAPPPQKKYTIFEVEKTKSTTQCFSAYPLTSFKRSEEHMTNLIVLTQGFYYVQESGRKLCRLQPSWHVVLVA